MSKSRHQGGATRPRPWVPLQRATAIQKPHVLKMAETDEVLSRVLAEGEDDECWRNDQYVVMARRHPETGHYVRLSIRRDDRKAIRDWRHLQQIKNDIAGPEIEAIELFPAESRLMDTSNQYWLWCFPPGVTLPVGFMGGRTVGGQAEADRYGAVQREMDHHEQEPQP